MPVALKLALFAGLVALFLCVGDAIGAQEFIGVNVETLGDFLELVQSRKSLSLGGASDRLYCNSCARRESLELFGDRLTYREGLGQSTENVLTQDSREGRAITC